MIQNSILCKGSASSTRSVFGHEPVLVFSEIARVLKPGGWCLVRDSKRLESGGSRIAAWAIALTIAHDFRRYYWSSIGASYTVCEMRAMLEGSAFSEWHIEEDLMDLLVVARA